MSNLALFDLDHTLLPLDSDYEWGQFMVRIGVVDVDAYSKRNAEFYVQYQTGTLDPIEYLRFVFGTLARFSRVQLDTWHEQFMTEVIRPAILPAALELVQRHRERGDDLAIITATNRFVTAPIAAVFGVEKLIAAEPELSQNGDFTGGIIGAPPFGPGKVVNLKAWLAESGRTLKDYSRSYFYSDSQNDIPLMSLVTDPVATNPNASLLAHAQAQGWPILHLFQ